MGLGVADVDDEKRTRKWAEKLTPKDAGALSPYHKAALAALRKLTGKDTTPTANAWRKLLDLPAKTVEVRRYSNGKSIE